MAKIPTILEAGRADGKLATTNSIFDENKRMFQSEINDIQDTLNSDNPNKPLSANQGKILKELLDSKVIEAGSVPIDTEPIEGNITHLVNSDGLAKEFNKYNTEIILGSVYDVSAHNNRAVFESLSNLLSSSNLNTLIPISVRRGGMTIRFIQSSKLNSDNKYVQYRLMSNEWSTNPIDWQGVDDKPVKESDNLVKSGGIWNAITRNENNIPSKLFICDENGNVVLDLSNGFVKTKNFDSTKIPKEIESFLQIINENYEKIKEVENKINLKISDEFGPIRLFIKDKNGNVLLELYDGVIKTKSFNSNVLPTINTNNNNEFNICDCFGNVLLTIKNGNIISKKFNSNDVNTLSLRVSEIERKSDGYDSLIARSTPAISWIDDDFDTYSVERLNKLNILKSWAIENNIKPDIALIPDVTFTDAQKTDRESVYFNNERLSLAMEFEYSGIHMLTHPIHYGIYGDVIKDDHYIKKNLFLSRKALLDAGFPGCDIFVYGGSSVGVAGVVEAAKAYYDVAIMPGGNATNVNLPTKQNRFRLVRFSLDDISATNTVSQIKQQIDECIATGGWIIFITHVRMHTGDGTESVDETSNSLSNVFNIIQYANQKVQIRPTQEVWKEKKILWEYYK